MMPFTRATVLGGALVILLAAPAAAVPDHPDSGAEAFEEAVREVAPEVFRGLASDTVDVQVDGTDAAVELNDIAVSLPVDAEAALESTLGTGDSLLTDGDVAVAPVAKEDGSVQVTMLISDDSAPLRYDFEIDAVPGGVLSIQSDGSALYVGSDGSLLLGAAAPWARDANGKTVPTRFEVDGTTLTQVVDHRSAGVAYPVIADPWLGIDLFSRVWTDRYNGDIRINARKSTWGHAMHTPTGQGLLIMQNAGWNEVKAKAPLATSKRTLQQQYDCHVLGGYGTLAGDWNLERFRPTRTASWAYGVAVHRCNWTTAAEGR